MFCWDLYYLIVDYSLCTTIFGFKPLQLWTDFILYCVWGKSKTFPFGSAGEIYIFYVFDKVPAKNRTAGSGSSFRNYSLQSGWKWSEVYEEGGTITVLKFPLKSYFVSRLKSYETPIGSKFSLVCLRKYGVTSHRWLRTVLHLGGRLVEIRRVICMWK